MEPILSEVASRINASSYQILSIVWVETRRGGDGMDNFCVGNKTEIFIERVLAPHIPITYSQIRNTEQEARRSKENNARKKPI